MKTLSWSAGIALLALAVCVPNAGAELLKCQRTIAKANAQYLQAKVKAENKCESAVVKTGTGSCPDAKTTAAVAKSAAKLAAAIAKSCGGSDKVCNGDIIDEDLPLALGWPATCPNLGHETCNNKITSCAGIATCLTCVAGEAANESLSLSYDQLVLPSIANPTLNKCQLAIGKATSAFLGAQSKALQKCWDGRLNGKHANSCEPPNAGDGKYLAAIAKAKDKELATIGKACGGADKALGGGDDQTPVQIGFPAACPAVMIPGGAACGAVVGDLTGIATCVDCLAQLEAACVDRIAVPQFAAYPPECTDCLAPEPIGACPGMIEFTADGPNVDLDTGWTGNGHDATVPSEGRLTLATSLCAGGSQPTCGQCNVSGPQPNAGGAAYNNRRCQDAPWVQCNVDGDCPSGTCIYFFGAPIPLVAGGVHTCVVNELSGAVNGTANLTDGTSSINLPLTAKVHSGIVVDHPCPNCVIGGVAGACGGLPCCNAGPRVNQPCTTMGSGIFGDLSLDCIPDPPSNIGTLSINLTAETGTQMFTLSAANPACTDSSFISKQCACDTCNNLNAEACSSNADCPDPAGPIGPICGGKRCRSGTNAGAACVLNSECPGGLCARVGQPTQPDACIGDPCAPTGGNEGMCPDGPVDTFCSIEKFRSCVFNSDCIPISAGGTCETCVAGGQTCVSANRECFLGDGDIGSSVSVTGSAEAPCGDSTRPEVGAFFCVGPTSAGSVNSAAGLPGLGRLRLPGRVVTLP